MSISDDFGLRSPVIQKPFPTKIVLFYRSTRLHTHWRRSSTGQKRSTPNSAVCEGMMCTPRLWLCGKSCGDGTAASVKITSCRDREPLPMDNWRMLISFGHAFNRIVLYGLGLSAVYFRSLQTSDHTHVINAHINIWHIRTPSKPASPSPDARARPDPPCTRGHAYNKPRRAHQGTANDSSSIRNFCGKRT